MSLQLTSGSGGRTFHEAALRLNQEVENLTLLSYSYSITGISKPADKVECTKQMHLKLSANLIIRGGIRMKELKQRIHENGIDYVLVGDYYIPAVKLPEEERPIGKWGRMHRAYLEDTNPLLLNHLILTGRIFTYLADLNEQAQDRYRRIVRQMMEAEGVTEDMKRRSQWEWVRAMNSIANRAEEIVKAEMIYT